MRNGKWGERVDWGGGGGGGGGVGLNEMNNGVEGY